MKHPKKAHQYSVGTLQARLLPIRYDNGFTPLIYVSLRITLCHILCAIDVQLITSNDQGVGEK